MVAAREATGIETNLGFILKQVAAEKGIDMLVLKESVEAAILKAAESVFGPTRELEARFNDETGQVDLFLYMTVVEEVAQPEREIALAEVGRRNLEAELGEELGFQVFWHPNDSVKARQQDEEFGDLLQLKQARSAFGRIAAQTAKQVLLSRVRDAERDIIFNQFKDKQGELIKGIARRFEKGNNIIVDLDKTEGILPSREQTPRETYRPGDRIVALIKVIDRESRGPQVVLSRADPRLVEKLFEAEVPEIYEGIVRIVGVAREAGARSKIAVTSRDADVDPVGACVGMKGSRVQAVVQELRGEKIDIVPFDRDPAKYVIAAIQPAEVLKVIVDEADHRMELVVPDEKLSLAIGRKGQNVRLAAQLTGWKLDIISDSRFKQLEDESVKALQSIDGVDEAAARAMYRAGFRSPDEIADASAEEIATISGLAGEGAAARVHAAAEAAQERQRQERIRVASAKLEMLGEREKFLLVRGVSERAFEALAEAGYVSLDSVANEDPDRLGIQSGLGPKQARVIKDNVRAFLESEWRGIETARGDARRAAAATAAATAASAGDRALEPVRANLGKEKATDVVPSTPATHRRRGAPAPAGAGPWRTCVGCGERANPAAMARFVVDAAGVPRLDRASVGSRTAPLSGRGAHVHARTSCLGTAARKGFARAARREVHTDAIAIANEIASVALARAEVQLDAAARRGAVTPLEDGDANGLGHESLVVVACDAPSSTVHAASSAVVSGHAVALGGRVQLGKLLGRSDAPAVIVRDARAAKAIAEACALASGVRMGRAVEDG